MALVDGERLDPIRRSNEEREILYGRKGALSYTPMEGAPERSSVTEQIPYGRSSSIPYQPMERSSFALPPLSAAAGRAGGEDEPNVDWSKVAPAGALGTSTRFPGTGGLGSVVGMGFVEVGAGLAALAEVLTGGRLGTDTRRALNEQAGRIFDNLAPEVQAALSREFTDLGPEGVLQNPTSYGYQLAKQIPILASLLVPAGGGAAIGGRIGASLATRRLGTAAAERLGQSASQLAVNRGRAAGIQAGTTVAGPAGEAAVVAGMTANDIATGIEGAPDSVLMGAPLYAEARRNGASEAEAKRMLITELGRREAFNVGAGAAVLSVLPAAVFGRILSGAARGKRAAVEGLVVQPVTEIMQEPFEGYRGDVAAQQSYDPSRVPGEDSLERAVAGGALGLGTGAALVGSGVVGRRMFGIDKIDEGDRKGQMLGDPALEGAIPPPPPPPQMALPGMDVPQPPEGGPPAAGSFVNRRGETMAVPPRPALTEEQQAADAALEGMDQAAWSRSRIRGPEGARTEALPGEMGAAADRARTAARDRVRAADEAAAYDEGADQQLRILTNQLERDGVIDRMTGKPIKKAKDQTKEEKARLKELEALRSANPDLAKQLELEQLEARIPDDWFDSAGKPKKGLAAAERTAANRLLQLRRELAPQMEMDLPQGRDVDVARRATRDETMRRARQEPLALPAPAPSEADVQAELDSQALQEVRASLQLLEEQETLSEADKARRTALRRQLKKLEATPVAAQQVRRAQAEDRRAQAEDRRARAAGTETETGEAIQLPDEFRTLETRGPRRNVRSRTQLQLQTVAPRDIEGRIERLAQKISEGRAKGQKVDHLIQQRKGLLRQLESLAGRPDREVQLETLREDLAAAEAAAAELEARPDPVFKRGAKKAGEVNEKAKAELDKARAAARAKARRLRTELEQAKAPELDEDARDTKTKSLFAGRTPEKEVRAAWQKKRTTVTEAKGLLQDAMRTSMLEIMQARDKGEVYSDSTARAMLRVRGELARRIKNASDKDALLKALHDLAYNADGPIGDSGVTVLDLAHRVYRNLTGEQLPAEGAFAQPDTVEQLMEVAAGRRQYGTVTGTTIEGADATEAEVITAAEEELTQLDLVQQALQASEEAAADLTNAALGVTEAELADMGRLDEATSEQLDTIDDINLENAPSDEDVAKYIASEEVADTYAVSLPPTDAQSALQRLADRVARELVEVLGARETRRLLRQTLALFSENGLFTTEPAAREVLTRWRGNVMLYALQRGDSELQTAAGLMSEAANPDIQAAWFLRTMTHLASDPALELSLREMLGGRDTDMLRQLGGVSEQLRQLTDYTQLGEQITNFGRLTSKTDAELLAMSHEDLRKFINSRLGIELPRKGKKEKGYTKQDMVNALRAREEAMRAAFEVFAQVDPELAATEAQWTQIIKEGLGETRITDEQLAEIMRALAAAQRNAKDGKPIDPITTLREILGELFPTDHKYIATRDKILQRDAVKLARLNHKLIFQMMNRVSQRFGKFVKDRVAEAELGRKTVYMPPNKVAEQVANDIEAQRRDTTQAARQEGAARGRLTQAMARERDRLMNDTEYQEQLAETLTKAQLRVIYGRFGLPVPGETDLPSPATVEGGRELGEEIAGEGRRLYGAVSAGDLPLERRTDTLPVNLFLRLGDPDIARSYIENEVRRFLEANPEATQPQIAKHLRQLLEVPASSMAENRKTGRLTDAQFVKLLDGLGFTKSFPETRLGENFDRHFAVNQILNSIHAFGTPVFTGGQFLSFYARQAAETGTPQYGVVAALGTAHENVVRAVARYLNNDNEVPGNKSAQMQFIMASDRFQQMWSEGLHTRAIREENTALDLEGEATIGDLTAEQRQVEVEQLNEILANYDRLLARYATNPAVVEEVLQQRQQVVELRDLLSMKDPTRAAKRRVRKSHDEYINVIRDRIMDTEARIGALKSEIGATKKRDRDWQNRKATGTTITRVHYLESSLKDAEMDLQFLEWRLEEAKKEAKRAVAQASSGTLAAAMQQIARLDARLNEITEAARTGKLVADQLAEDAGIDADTLNAAESDKRLAQLRESQAKVWPRANRSLESIVEWAKSADSASRRIINEVVSLLHKNRDPKDMVTTSSLETIAPYSNETVAGSRLVEWIFMVKQRDAPTAPWRGQRGALLPPVVRGSVAQILATTKSDPRYNATVSFDSKALERKSHKLNTLTVSEFNALRDEVRAAYVANPTPQLAKAMEKLADFASLDAELRYAYVKAYNLIGDIHRVVRIKPGKGAGTRASTRKGRIDGVEGFKELAESLQANIPLSATSEVVSKQAAPKPMTQKQRRAAQEQQRQAEHAAAPEGGPVEGWVDQSPEAELARLEQAVSAGEVLPQFYTLDRDGTRVPSMGRQKHRLNQLRTQLSQTMEEVNEALRAGRRKNHMDLPLEEARNQILGSSLVGDSLRAARNRPVSVQDIVGQMIESGLIDDLPLVTRIMLRAVYNMGIDIPIRWVDSKPVDGKTFLGRYAFDKDNPARGREILINGYAYDALLNKELDLEFTDRTVDGRLAHVFAHELAHAATHLRLLTDPALQREFGSLLGVARRILGEVQGTKDVFEFVAEYFSNEKFQRDLQFIRINHNGQPMTLWQRFTDIIRQLFLRPRDNVSMFDYMMDRSSALFMSEQMVEQLAEAGMSHELSQGYLNYEITMDPASAAAANTAELAAEQVARFSWLPRAVQDLAIDLGGVLRKGKLGLMTLDQIGESYAGIASGYTNLQNRKWAEINRDMDSANRMMQDFAALGKETSDRLSTLMLQATNYSIHPDQPLGPNTPNAHLDSSKETMQAYNILKELWDSLPAEAKEIYQRVKQRHAEDYAKTTRYVTDNLMAAFDFDIDQLPEGWYDKLQSLESASEQYAYLEQLWDKHALPDPKTGQKRERGFTEREAEALVRLARRPKMFNGPYFPMKRFGKYLVRAKRSIGFTFENEAEMAQVLDQLKAQEPGVRFEGFEGDSLSGTVHFQLVEMYERRSQAVRRRAEVANEKLQDMLGRPIMVKGQQLTWGRVEEVVEKAQLPMYELAGHYSSSFLTRLQDKLKKNPAALAAVKEAYLHMLPDTSMRKHELRRGNILGASDDMVRSFAATTKASAYGAAQIKYGRKLSAEMQAMQERARNEARLQPVVDELQKRDMTAGKLMSEDLLAVSMDRATEAGFLWYLGSPSYWMVNATQPYLLTLPYLSARYGTAKSYAAMARARKQVFPTLAGKAARSGLGLKALRRDPKAHREFMRDIFGGLDDLFAGIKDPNARAMMEEVEQLGLIDLTIAKDLNQVIKSGATNKAEKAWESLIDTTRVMPHLVEVLNRSMTALAAYDLASQSGMGHEQATAAAVDAIRKTQFNYSAINKARFMSRTTSELLRPVMLFMQYSQHVYYLMLRSAIDGFSAAKTPEERKQARKTFWRIIGAHTLAAGTLGGMFEPFRVALGIAFGLAQMVGLADEDDEFEAWWQRGMADIFGQRGGMIVSKGLPYGLLGLDLHSRVGLNNLIHMDDPRVAGMEGREWLVHKTFGFFGPLGDMAGNFADVKQKLSRGDTAGALSAAMPKGIRDPLRAIQWNDVGVLDYTGNTIMQPAQLDTMSLVYKFFGFNPSSVSQMYSSRGAVRRAEARINKKRARLMERWRRAEGPAQRKVLDDINEFNRAYPEFRIDGRSRIEAKRRKRENERQAAQQGGYYSGRNPRQTNRVRPYGDF